MALAQTIQQKLVGLNITNSMPAWKIIDSANLSPTTSPSSLFVGTEDKALKDLMNSFYEYGRNNGWTWTQSSSGLAGNGGLVKGNTTQAACATFNLNFKWLAENILGINNITLESYMLQFLTKPGVQCIDVNWDGNVKTDTANFDILKCFKFKEHYWVKCGSTNYDVCFNNTFNDSSEFILTNLKPPDDQNLSPDLKNKAPGDVWKLETPYNGNNYLLMNGKNHDWPAWELLNKK